MFCYSRRSVRHPQQDRRLAHPRPLTSHKGCCRFLFRSSCAKQNPPIECNNTGFYTVYTEEDFPFGFFGEGYTAEEAKADFLNVFYGMRDRHFKKTGEYVDAEFTFVYDASAM